MSKHTAVGSFPPGAKAEKYAITSLLSMVSAATLDPGFANQLTSDTVEIPCVFRAPVFFSLEAMVCGRRFNMVVQTAQHDAPTFEGMLYADMETRSSIDNLVLNGSIRSAMILDTFRTLFATTESFMEKMPPVNQQCEKSTDRLNLHKQVPKPSPWRKFFFGYF